MVRNLFFDVCKMEIVKEQIAVCYNPNYNGYGRTYGWWQNFHTYEPHTFQIVKEFADPDKAFVDVGVHIGSVSIFASNLYARVIGFEPDHKAFLEALANIVVNPTADRIFIHNLAIGDSEAIVKLAHQGPAGSGESSLLARETGFERRAALPGRPSEFRSKHGFERVAQIGPSLLKVFVPELEAGQVALIKLDIEGGEKYVVPQLSPLIGNKCPLLISLHYVFLDLADIAAIVQQLFVDFERIVDAQTRQPVTRNQVLDSYIHDLLCYPKKNL